MDKERQFRFLYPPLVFVGFWLLGVKLDPTRTLLSYLPNIVGGGNLTASELVGILAGGGAVVLVAGFLTSVFSVVALQFVFRRLGHPTYEVVWSADTRKRIAKFIGVANATPDQDIYLAVIFDHLLLPDPVHNWVFRRWSSFYITFNSCMALVLSLIVCWWSGMSVGWRWYLAWSVCLVFLGLQARFSFRDTMGMFEFYSQLDVSMLNHRAHDRIDRSA